MSPSQATDSAPPPDLRKAIASTQLSIGTHVWFHSREFTPFQRPRCAIITGPGAQPTLLNLTVFTEALADVENGRKPPILIRRNIPILSGYPANWPMEDFAVYPPTAVPHLDPTKAPHGGIPPAPAAGRLTVVEPYGRGQEAAAAPLPDGMTNGHVPVATVPAGVQTPQEPVPPQAPGYTETIAPPPMGELKPAPGMEGLVQTPAAPPKSTPAPVVAGAVHGSLIRLAKHPAWGRELDDLSTKIESGGDEIKILSSEGIHLLTIGQRESGTKRGYLLKTYGSPRSKAPDKEILSGLVATEEVRNLIVTAGRIARKGQKAKDLKAAIKATATALAEDE